MTLAEFEAYVKAVVNVGDTADPFIPAAVRQAVMWIERNYSYLYMEATNLGGDRLEAGDVSYPLVLFADIAPPGFAHRVKSIVSVRLDLPEVGAEFWYPEQANKLNFESPTPDGNPTHFYFGNQSFGLQTTGTVNTLLSFQLVFNKAPTEDLTVFVTYVQYTDWDYVEDDGEHWLMEYAEDLLLAQTLMQLAVPLKDPDLYAPNKVFRDEALRTSISADLELRQSAESPEMLFG